MFGARRTERLEELAEDVRPAGGSAEHHPPGVTDAEQVRAFGAERLAPVRNPSYSRLWDCPTDQASRPGGREREAYQTTESSNAKTMPTTVARANASA